MHLQSTAFVGLAASAATLLPRMRREFDSAGELSPSTTTMMWGCYVAATGLYANALRHGKPASRRTRIVSLVTAASGLGLTTAGMNAFQSASQIAAREAGSLVVGGVYRVSRNPQYVGCVIAAAAGAAARRSLPALGIASAYAVICRWWVGVEERALEQHFGGDYHKFKATTPRWLGLPGAP